MTPRRSLPRGSGTVCIQCGNGEAWSRGLCQACYQRERTSGRLEKIRGNDVPSVLLGDDDTKVCRVCGETRTGREFWADKRAKDGKQSSCRDCNAKQTAEWKRANPEAAKAIRERRKPRSKEEWREWRYGITPEQFQLMVEEQEALCAICGEVPTAARGLVVDHDHTNGVIRGLLCSGCNSGLGFLGDTIEGLQRAIVYLQRSQDMTDIRKTSRSPEVPIVKQGHTSSGSFGSDPNKKAKGRAVRDITIPTAKG